MEDTTKPCASQMKYAILFQTEKLYIGQIYRIYERQVDWRVRPAEKRPGVRPGLGADLYQLYSLIY